MAKYGEIAISAVEILQKQKETQPADAWNQAARLVYPESESSRKKSCPKSAFLGLCEEGAIRYISSGVYTNSAKNKSYALAALSLLRSDPAIANDKKLLWAKVQNGTTKKHNDQMDVVISLWECQLFH